MNQYARASTRTLGSSMKAPKRFLMKIAAYNYGGSIRGTKLTT